MTFPTTGTVTTVSRTGRSDLGSKDAARSLPLSLCSVQLVSAVVSSMTVYIAGRGWTAPVYSEQSSGSNRTQHEQIRGQ